MADSKISYGPDAPKLSPEQLQEFKPASYLSTPQLADPPDEEESIWGDGLAAIFGIDTLTTRPTEPDTARPKPVRKRKAAAKPD
jgi:hypothetical protein